MDPSVDPRRRAGGLERPRARLRTRRRQGGAPGHRQNEPLLRGGRRPGVTRAQALERVSLAVGKVMSRIAPRFAIGATLPRVVPPRPWRLWRRTAQEENPPCRAKFAVSPRWIRQGRDSLRHRSGLPGIGLAVCRAGTNGRAETAGRGHGVGLYLAAYPPRGPGGAHLPAARPSRVQSLLPLTSPLRIDTTPRSTPRDRPYSWPRPFRYPPPRDRGGLGGLRGRRVS
jgi:hypothetical protein